MSSEEHEFDGQPETQEWHILDYADVLLRRWRLLIAITVAVTAIASVRAFMAQSVYASSAQILIDRSSPRVLEFRDVADAGAKGPEFLQTQLELLESRNLARRSIESLGLLQDPEFGGPREPAVVEEAFAAEPGASPLLERAIDTFKRRLRILVVKDSQIVAVGFESFRPELCARVANELAKKYIEQTLEFRYETSSEAAEWLRLQIEDQESKIVASETELQRVRERDGIVNIEERRVLLNQQLSQQGSSLNALQTQHLERAALHRQMLGASNPGELPEVINSGVVQELRSRLVELQRLETELLEKYLEQHPDVVKVRRQIAEVDVSIRTEAEALIRVVQNSAQAAAAQAASLESALEATKREIMDLDRRAVQYDSMKRELDAHNQVLDSLLSRHKETDVAQALKTSNIRVVDAAVVPTRPARPNRLVESLFGLVIGLSLGVGLAFFLEYLDNTVRTPQDVRERLRAPLLGVIPQTESKAPGPVLLTAQSGSPFAEGYRVLRTSLNYAWPSREPRIVLVTSTSPGEGKTLTSVNLALTLASAGGRVLILDADMRRPQVHNLLKVAKRPGLSDLLVGQKTVAEAMHQVTGTNLSVLPSGTQVPSPGDLMTTEVIENLLRSLKQSFAWVVIDTPPVAAVADALALGRLTDGVIVVAGAEMVPRGAVRHTLERVAGSGARLLGVVLNRLQIRRQSQYYGHYYGHYYAQNYGRTQEDEAPKKVARFRASG